MALELRPLALPIQGALDDGLNNFDCCGEAHADDEIAQEVNAFLHEGHYAAGLEHGLSSTYLYLDTTETPPGIAGYVTLALDSVRVTDSEKRELGRPDFPDIGAIRIVMIGVDCRRQQGGTGSALLAAVVGLARHVDSFVASRFLVADVNPTKQEWYARRHFVENRAGVYQREGRSTVSMRLDLRAPRDS